MEPVPDSERRLIMSELTEIEVIARRLVDDALEEFFANKAFVRPEDPAEAEFKSSARTFILYGTLAAVKREQDRDDAWSEWAKPTLCKLAGWVADTPLGVAAGFYGYGKLANAWLSLDWPYLDDEQSDEDDDT
jgi:hypothetical protein